MHAVMMPNRSKKDDDHIAAVETLEGQQGVSSAPRRVRDA